MHDFTLADQDWIGLVNFKNFADQDWIGFNFVEQEWTRSEKFDGLLISGILIPSHVAYSPDLQR